MNKIQPRFLTACLFGSTMAIGLTLLGATADEPARQPGTSNQQEKPTQILTVTPSQLMERPQAYRGKTVRLKSHLAEEFGPHAFGISAQRGAAGEVLVLIPVLRPYAFGEKLWEEGTGVPVTIVGKARVFRQQQFEADYDWFSVNLFRERRQVADWAGRPVVVAQSVRTSGGRELVDSAASGMEAARPAISSSRASRQFDLNRPIQDLRTLFAVQDQDRLLRMRVLLSGVQVQRVLNPHWVMVGTADEQQILARLPRRHPPVQIGDRIDLSGVIRRVPASPGALGLRETQLALAERPGLYIYTDDVED